MAGWRFVAVAAVLVGYALLSYWLMAHAPANPWTVVALFSPLVAGMAANGWKRRHAPTLLLCAAIALVLAVVVARGGVGDVARLYVLQHGALHAVLGWSFAMTLRHGATPLITAIAERVHTEFTPEMRAYTRWLTGLWVAYFFGMIAVSLVIYAFAPWLWWSLYANLLTPLAAVALFVGEHLLRYLRHPEFERATIARALQAYRARQRATGLR